MLAREMKPTRRPQTMNAQPVIPSPGLTYRTAVCGTRLYGGVAGEERRLSPLCRFRTPNYFVALPSLAAFSAVVASAVVALPNLVSRGKNGVTSNGILSRIEVMATGAAFTIST